MADDKKQIIPAQVLVIVLVGVIVVSLFLARWYKARVLILSEPSAPEMAAGHGQAPSALSFNIPVNALPGDEEIEKGIQAQKTKNRALEESIAIRKKKAAEIRGAIVEEKDRAISAKIPEEPGAQKPSQEILEKVKSHEYVVH